MGLYFVFVNLGLFVAARASVGPACHPGGATGWVFWFR